MHVHCRPGFGGSFVEWCELPEVEGIHVGSVSKQCLSHLAMTIGAGVVKRNKSTETMRNIITQSVW